MAHFNYTRTGGVWATLTPALASELADLDAKTFKAINGDEGGTWAPSSAIVLGGQGLEIASDASLRFQGSSEAIFASLSSIRFEAGSGAYLEPGSDIVVTDGAHIDVNGYIGVWGSSGYISFALGGSARFENSSKAEFQSGATAEFKSGAIADFKEGAKATFASTDALSPSTAEFDGAWALAWFKNGAGALFSDGAQLVVSDGEVKFQSDATVSFSNGSTTTFGGTATFSGTTTLDAGGSHQLKDALVASGVGRVTKRIISGDDADKTYGIGDADIIRVQVITNDRTYTISTTGANKGDQMRIYLVSGLYTLTVKDGATNNTLAALKASGGSSGEPRAIDIVFFNSAWTVIGTEYYP